MPHLTLEYSAPVPISISIPEVLARLHAALEPLDLFAIEEIKSRAVPHALTYVGRGAPESVFLHLTVAILSGRDLATRQRIADTCVASLQESLADLLRRHPCDVTVEIREMQRETYRKVMNELARAAGSRAR